MAENQESFKSFLAHRPPHEICNQLHGQSISSNTGFNWFICSMRDLIILLTPIDEFYLQKNQSIPACSFQFDQRPIDNRRVDKMKNSLIQYYLASGLFGLDGTTISLAVCDEFKSPNNQLGIAILDGQHRLKVARELQGKLIECYGEKVDLINQSVKVTVHLYIFNNLTEVREKFIQINENYVQVPPEHLNTKLKNVIDEIIKWIKNNGSHYISNSLGCHRPQINIDRTRNKLQNNEIFKNDVEHMSIQDIIGKISRFNSIIRNQEYWYISVNISLSERNTIENAYDKCRTYGFYLGMWKLDGWVDECFKDDPD